MNQRPRAHVLGSLLVLLALSPVLALAAQPMDRYTRLLDQEKYETIVEDAGKWLGKNEGDERAEAVQDLLDEAAWRIAKQGASLEGMHRYRIDHPSSDRCPEALELEASFGLDRAREIGTEQAFLDHSERYRTTKAAASALALAEEAAWRVVTRENLSGSFAGFRERYPSGVHRAEADRLYLDRRWDESEAEGTVQAWAELRALRPEHPRAAEAYEREQQAALALLGPDPSSAALLDFATSYEGSERGWEVLTLAVSRARVLISQAPGTEVLAIKLVQNHGEGASGDPFGLLGLVSAELELPGELPPTAQVSFSVQVQDSSEWVDWNTLAEQWAERWVLPVLSHAPATPKTGTERPRIPWSTERPVCGPDVAGILGRYTATLSQGDRSEQWTEDFLVQRRCGGPVPLAVRRDADRRISALGFVGPDMLPRVQELTIDAGGLGWVCTGETVLDKRGLWLTCNGWEISPRPQGFFVRVPGEGAAVDGAGGTGEPPSTSAGGALAELPTGEGEQWFAVSVAPRDHFGSPPPCPQPKGFGAVHAGGASTAPDAPAWLPPELLPSLDRADDIDGDGIPERVLRVNGPRGGCPWVIVVPGRRFGIGSWAAPLAADAKPGTLPRIEHDGCAYRFE